MNNMQELDAKKSELTKIALDLENGDVQVNQEQGTPEQILEIVEEAMEILDEAREALPVNNAIGNTEHADEGMQQVDSLIAKVKKAIDEDTTDDGEGKKDDDDETKKEAKTTINQDKEDSDDDKEKDAKVRIQEARIATLEKELNQRNRIAIVEKAASDLYPEEVRSAKVDELINSIGTNRSLEAKIKFAKDVLESQKATKNAKTFGSNEIFRTKKAKQQSNVVDAWVV